MSVHSVDVQHLLAKSLLFVVFVKLITWTTHSVLCCEADSDPLDIVPYGSSLIYNIILFIPLMIKHVGYKCQRSIFTLKLHVRWWNNCPLLCLSPFRQSSVCHVHVCILLLTAVSSLMMDEWSNDRLGAHGFQEEVDGIAWLTDAGMRHVARNFPNTTTLEISHCPLLSNPILWFLPGNSLLLIVHSGMLKWAVSLIYRLYMYWASWFTDHSAMILTFYLKVCSGFKGNNKF